MKTPQEDPELKRQQQEAEAEKIEAIRERVGAKTNQMARLYGSRYSLGGGTGVPLLMGL